MPFNSDLIQVLTKKQSKKYEGKYVNLTYGPKGTITFLLKDCYSHFGMTYSKKCKTYSIGITVTDAMYDKLRAVEEKVGTLLDKKLTEPLLRRLKKNCEFNNFYLKLREDQFDNDMLEENHVKVNAQITLSSVYLGYVHPSLLVCVDKISIEKCPMPERVVIEDSDDGEGEHVPIED